MVSSVISCINSRLHELESLVISFPDYDWRVYSLKILKVGLRNIKVFLLCFRKLGDDEYLRSSILGPLLSNIEDRVGRIERIISLDCSPLTRMSPALLGGSVREIHFLEEEVDEWYTTRSNHAGQSSSLTAEEVVDISESILENKEEFLSFKEQGFEIISVELMDALEVQITFLQSFLLFTLQTGRELGNLLIHFEHVAISAARFFVIAGDRDHESDKDLFEDMQSKCSELLRKIKPIDAHVYEAYTQSLNNSKFSSQGDDDIITLKNFLDSLISVVWDLLREDACHSVCSSDQLQVLFEGLRLCRTFLRQQQSENIDETIREEIGVWVCDAGKLVCAFHQTNVQSDPSLQNVLQRINVIQAKVEQKVPQPVAFNFPRTNDLGFVDSMLDNLKERLTSFNALPIAKNLPQALQEQLVFLKSFLGETMELHNEQEELQIIKNRVLDVAYKVELVIDRIVVGGISNSFSNLFDSIVEEIKGIKTDLVRISYSPGNDIKVQKLTTTSSHQLSQSGTLSGTTDFIGFHTEETSILDRLKRGSKQLRMVAIFGMPGIGKTTLALKVYNNPSLKHHFHACAWCSVSQVLDKRKVLLELLYQIVPGAYFDMTEQDIADKLRRALKGKRYLILLDDVWTTEAWTSLEGSFPNDSTQSRIILTSRHCNIAPLAMLDEEPHLLRLLTNQESFELLERKLFPGKTWPTSLNEIGMEIAEYCKGLPLTITIVAGLLATTKQGDWKQILDALSSDVVSDTEQWMNTLELSYKFLPNYLKPCFLYFGVFPEDQEVSVKRLIQLWIAEGFVRQTKLKRIEVVAGEYMANLIERSLVMVVKKGSIGGAKTCRVHDLLHYFCQKKAKEESFFHLLQGHDHQLSDFNEPRYLRRLCIYANPVQFKESKLFCSHARSLLLFFSTQSFTWFCASNISFICHIFKLLRVLDADQIPLADGLPNEIKLLIQLRYLSFRSKMAVIPSWIGNLCNLETLIVHILVPMVSLPHTLWDIQTLRYLHIRNGSNSNCGGGILPLESLESSSTLFRLETFSFAVIYSRANMEKQMRKFPNIRRLKCHLLCEWGSVKKFDKIVVPNFLSQLESLKLTGDALYASDCEFSLPANLRKLTLSNLMLSKREISIIGRLPNLEVLKLLYRSLFSDTLEMEEGEFLKLKFLKLNLPGIVDWTASDEQLPCLQKLVLQSCNNLKELPSCLESISTLEEIEVFDCSHDVESSVMHIQEIHKDFDNLVNVHIH